MQLLVSVRSSDEVEPALVGGADIIDAKEPGNGSLGAVSAATLAPLVSAVPSDTQFSLALGEMTSVEQVIATIAGVELPRRRAMTYLKLGFAGVPIPGLVHEIMAAAVRSSTLKPVPTSIVAVAYADGDRAGALPADLILRLASAAGVAGVLVDTYDKDGPGLMDSWTASEVARWTSLAKRSGLLVGVAGRLESRDVVTVAQSGADVIGFRGAACDGGRSGLVTLKRVHLLRRCLDGVPSGVGHSAYAAGSPWRNAGFSGGNAGSGAGKSR